jgi:peptidoglycan/LPS O-acetylase OafA/YrhL
MASVLDEGKRFTYLDSTRGLAALSVAIWHFLVTFFDPRQPGIITTSPLHIFWYSEADIIFFFVYSGFVLSYSYTGSQKPLRLSSFMRFLIERVFRIYPLFLFILFTSFFLKNSIFPLTPAKYSNQHFQLFWSQVESLRTVIREAILFIPVPEPGNFHLIPQDWTLEVEIVVGAFVPFLGFLIRKNKVVYWVAVFSAILFLHLNAHLIEFACGVFIFSSWKDILRLWNRLGILLKLAAGVLSVILYSCFFQFSSLFYADRIFIRQHVDRVIVICGCCMLLSIVLSSGVTQKVLSLPLFVKIGRICYSIYLTHMLLLICFADYLMVALHHLFNLPEILYLLIAFIIFISVTLFISFLTFSFIERPFNKIGKKIGQRVEKSIFQLGKSGLFPYSRFYL